MVTTEKLCLLKLGRFEAALATSASMAIYLLLRLMVVVYLYE